ncbi:Ionotropic receptor 75a [Gryllus bimaculatus]|nr:Ionotropic receptor 75a [Gryllus bimaculatus]
MVVTDRATLRHLHDGVDKHIDTITKVDFVLVGLVAHMMNASIQHTVLNTWGYNTNGSWSGMVGYLQRGQAEIGGTGLFFTTDRIPVIDYIAMTTPTGSAFIFREPPLSYVSNLFTLPFEGDVWAASTALLALTAGLLLAAAAWEDAVEPPDATRLPARWADPARFMELNEGFRRVRRGLFAFHAEFSTGYHIIQRTFREDEKCGIQTIRFLQVIDPYLAIRKNSSYKEVIKMGFRKMRERGVQSRTWRRLLTPKPECLGKGSSFVSVGIVECYPVLMVLVYGLALAASMLLLEKLLHRRSAKLLGVMDSLFRSIWNSQKKPVRIVATYRQ